MTEKTDLNDLLSIKGIGEKVKEQLNNIDIFTIQDLMNTNEKELIEHGISKTKAAKLMREIHARKLGDFITADKLLEIRNNLPRISTGIDALDNILHGGIEVGDITGFYGEYRTGKTQICHQLSVIAQLPLSQGGLKEDSDVHIIYIDTEKSFRPERILNVINYLKLENSINYLKNIHIAAASTSDDQRFFVESIEERFSDKYIGLIIIDSLTGKFREEYPGRENLPTRQSLLSSHMGTLQRLADKRCAIVVTNQVGAKPDLMFGDPLLPVGGHTVNHRIQTYIKLSYMSKGRRKAKIIDSPSLPEAECIFKITESGVENFNQ